MAFQVNFLPEAQTDYDEAIAWYEREQPGLGLRFYLEMEEAVQQLSNHPTHSGFFIEQYRDVILKTFPYRLVFAISGNDVNVFAIFHTSRNNTEIYKRLK